MTTTEQQPLTKKQSALLAKIERVEGRRTAAKERLTSLDDDYRRLINQAFAEGLTGDQIAPFAHVSRPRVYQLRDEYRRTADGDQ